MTGPARFAVGVDVGGTFTDLIAIDPATGETRFAKVPTTPANQAEGFLAALDAAGIGPAEVAALVHGTTTTTNALLERKVARIGVIATKGFRDVLELGRRTRPKPYGLTGGFEPLAPRELRLEATERMDAEGRPVVPLDEATVRDAAARLLDAGCEAVVVHFLHSYANPAHERRAAEIVRATWPNPYVVAGHEVASEHREYERGTTAAIDAAVRPVLARYLGRLSDELRRRGFARELLVMQGNGGTASAAVAAGAAVHTVMSGPASGAIAAARTGRAAGFPDLVTYDMGGTSTDVGLIEGGVPEVSSELELEHGLPIHVPMVDVHTIGAGGGSVASVDASGLLRVGPESAGAVPGPICYGRGGERPTIADANLALGRLDPTRLLAVDAPVPLEHVRRRIAETVGEPLGLDWQGAAAAILRVANDRMAGAIRLVSLARGRDPRDFALFAFGGAGPLHATALARELGIPKVLVPPRPGITNALGCAVADLRHDFVRTVNRPLDALDDATVQAALEAQVAEGEAMIAREGVPVEGVERLHFADMQFQGQTHILTVKLARAATSVAELRAAFEVAYWLRFEVELPEIRPVLVDLRTATVGRRPAIDLAALAAGERAARVAEAEIGRRQVWFAEGGWIATPVYARDRLPLDARIEGPAILQQLDTTTVLEPGDAAVSDRYANLIVEVGR